MSRRELVQFTESENGPGGLLVKPAADDAGPWPGVVLLPAIAGVNDYVARQADRLAAAGYVCVVLDYYARQGGTPPDLGSPEKILAAVADLSDPVVLDDVGVAVSWLRQQGFTADKVGALGFCIGGTYALMAASRDFDLSCAITFYGILRYAKLTPKKPVSPLDTVGDVGCPVLGHFGETDHLVGVSDVRDLAERLRGRPAEIFTYPGAGHAFHEDFRPEIYRPVAANTAWERTLQYLSWYLRKPNESEAG